MNFALLEKPLFHVGQHYVSTLGVIAFAALFFTGLILARFLQSTFVRRLLSRFKLDTNFIAVVTMILSLASVVFFTVSAINAAGVPLPWDAPLPGVKLSLLQILLLIVMLVGVFWLSSHTKRFLFNRFLVNSGLNRSLQYALSQIISNIVLVIGILVVLTQTGINLGALAVFGTRIRGLQLVGMAVTLLGVAIVATKGDIGTLLALAFNIGDVWMLIACALYAAYTLGLRNRPQVPGLAFFALMAGVAFLTSLPLLGYEIAVGQVQWPTLQGLLITLYVGLFPSLLSQIFFMRGVELIGPGRAGIFVNLVPVFGALLAVVLLGEPFHLYHALALALVLGGIWLAERRRS